MKPLVLVTGTGTEIGKTVVSRGLVAAWARRGGAIAGIKPIESGVARGEIGGDVRELGQVSTFHVTRFRPPYLLMNPVSPHLAARREGRTIDPQVVVDWVAEIRGAADGVVLELPGGLFSPITDTRTNAHLVKPIGPTRVVLVAPDRLGVIHDVVATSYAARAHGIDLDALVLSSPPAADSSTGTNAAELARIAPDLRVAAVLPRATHDDLAPYFDRVLDSLGI